MKSIYFHLLSTVGIYPRTAFDNKGKSEISYFTKVNYRNASYFFKHTQNKAGSPVLLASTSNGICSHLRKDSARHTQQRKLQNTNTETNLVFQSQLRDISLKELKYCTKSQIPSLLKKFRPINKNGKSVTSQEVTDTIMKYIIL